MTHYIFTEKLYTDQQLAKDNSGIIRQALSHILRLKYKFNYTWDERKHKGDLYNDFVGPLLKKINSDNKSKGPEAVIDFYTQRLPDVVESDRKTILTDFRKHYGYKKSSIPDEDFNFALEVLKTCLILGEEEKIREYIKTVL